MYPKYKKFIESVISAADSSEILNNVDFIPELEQSKQVTQRHKDTVFTHTVAVVNAVDDRNECTTLSALFHDLGKIHTRTYCHKTDMIRFDGHEHQSVIIAREHLSEWNAPDDIISSVCNIIKTHMYDIKNTLNETSILKFIADVGAKNIDNWFVVRIADASSYIPSKYRPVHATEYVDRIITPFRVKVMDVLNKTEIFSLNSFLTERCLDE